MSRGKSNDSVPASSKRNALNYQGRSASLPQELDILRAAMTAIGPGASTRTLPAASTCTLPDALAGKRDGAAAAKQPCFGRTVRAFSMPVDERPDRMSNLGRGSLLGPCALETAAQSPAFD
jgi:hypothetical protein